MSDSNSDNILNNLYADETFNDSALPYTDPEEENGTDPVISNLYSEDELVLEQNPLDILNIQSQADATSPVETPIINVPEEFGSSQYDKNASRAYQLNNLEELRGRNQTGWDKFGNFVPRFIGGVGTNVVGGLGGVGYGILKTMYKAAEAPFTDKDDSAAEIVRNIWDNELFDGLDYINEELSENLPFYYTQQEKEASLFGQMAYGNFWADKFANGLTFITGAVLTELAAVGLGGLIGSVVPGAGTVAVGGAAAAGNAMRLTRQATKIFKNIGRATVPRKVIEAGKKVAQSRKTLDALKIGRQMMTGAGYEASIEAKHGYDVALNTLLTENFGDRIALGEQEAGRALTIEEKGNLLTPQERAEIFETAASISNFQFAGNLLLVGVGNMITLPGLYGAGVMSRMNKSAAKSSLYTKAKDALGFSGVPKRDVLHKALGKAGLGDKGITITRGLGSWLKRSLYEGFVEEGGQGVMARASEDYALRSRMGDNGTLQLIGEWHDAFARGFDESYGSKEGQTEILIGALAAALGMPGQGGKAGWYKGIAWTGDLASQSTKMEGIQEFEAVNKKFADEYARIKKANPSLGAKMEQTAWMMMQVAKTKEGLDTAIENGDVKKAKDFEYDKFWESVMLAIDSNDFESLETKIETDLSEISDEALKEMYSYEDDMTKEALAERRAYLATTIKQKLKTIKESQELVDSGLRLNDMDKVIGLGKPGSMAAVRRELIHYASKMDENVRREEAMISKLAEITGGKVVSISNEISSIEYQNTDGTKRVLQIGAMNVGSTVFEHIVESRRRIEDLEAKGGSRTQVENEQLKDLKNYITELEKIEDQSKPVYNLLQEAGSVTNDEQVAAWEKEFPEQSAKHKKEVHKMMKDIRALRADRIDFAQKYQMLIDPSLREKYNKQMEASANDLKKKIKQETEKFEKEQTKSEKRVKKFKKVIDYYKHELLERMQELNDELTTKQESLQEAIEILTGMKSYVEKLKKKPHQKKFKYNNKFITRDQLIKEIATAKELVDTAEKEYTTFVKVTYPEQHRTIHENIQILDMFMKNELDPDMMPHEFEEIHEVLLRRAEKEGFTATDFGVQSVAANLIKDHEKSIEDLEAYKKDLKAHIGALKRVINIAESIVEANPGVEVFDVEGKWKDKSSQVNKVPVEAIQMAIDKQVAELKEVNKDIKELKKNIKDVQKTYSGLRQIQVFRDLLRRVPLAKEWKKREEIDYDSLENDFTSMEKEDDLYKPDISMPGLHKTSGAHIGFKIDQTVYEKSLEIYQRLTELQEKKKKKGKELNKKQLNELKTATSQLNWFQYIQKDNKNILGRTTDKKDNNISSKYFLAFISEDTVVPEDVAKDLEGTWYHQNNKDAKYKDIKVALVRKVINKTTGRTSIQFVRDGETKGVVFTSIEDPTVKNKRGESKFTNKKDNLSKSEIEDIQRDYNDNIRKKVNSTNSLMIAPITGKSPGTILLDRGEVNYASDTIMSTNLENVKIAIGKVIKNEDPEAEGEYKYDTIKFVKNANSVMVRPGQIVAYDHVRHMPIFMRRSELGEERAIQVQRLFRVLLKEFAAAKESGKSNIEALKQAERFSLEYGGESITLRAQIRSMVHILNAEDSKFRLAYRLKDNDLVIYFKEMDEYATLEDIEDNTEKGEELLEFLKTKRHNVRGTLLENSVKRVEFSGKNKRTNKPYSAKGEKYVNNAKSKYINVVLNKDLTVSQSKSTEHANYNHFLLSKNTSGEAPLYTEARPLKEVSFTNPRAGGGYLVYGKTLMSTAKFDIEDQAAPGGKAVFSNIEGEDEFDPDDFSDDVGGDPTAGSSSELEALENALGLDPEVEDDVVPTGDPEVDPTGDPEDLPPGLADAPYIKQDDLESIKAKKAAKKKAKKEAEEAAKKEAEIDPSSEVEGLFEGLSGTGTLETTHKGLGYTDTFKAEDIWAEDQDGIYKVTVGGGDSLGYYNPSDGSFKTSSSFDFDSDTLVSWMDKTIDEAEEDEAPFMLESQTKALEELLSSYSKDTQTEIQRALKMTSLEIATSEAVLDSLDGRAVAQLVSFGKVVLSELAPSGAIFHEAFHNVSLYVLSPKDSKTLYKKIREIPGETVTYKGKTKKMSDLTNKEAEEWAAEEFRKYILMGKDYKFGEGTVTDTRNIIQKFFDAIKSVLRRLFRLNENFEFDSSITSIEGLFESIDKGKFAKAKRHQGRSDAGVYNMLQSIEGWNDVYTNDMISSISVELGGLIDKPFRYGGKTYKVELGELYTGDIFNTPVGKKSLNALYLKGISNLREKLITLENELDRFSERKPAVTETLDRIGRSSNEKKETVKQAIRAHYGYLTDIGLVKEEGVEVDEETLTSKDWVDELDALTISPSKSASGLIKLIFSMFEDPNTVNSTGLTGAYNMSTTLKSAQNLLAGSTSFANQIKKLKQNKEKFPWAADLVKRLDIDPEGKTYSQIAPRIAFAVHMAQVKLDVSISSVEPNGRIYTMDPAKEGALKKISYNWTSRLKNFGAQTNKKSNHVTLDKDGKILINKKAKFNFVSPKGTLIETTMTGLFNRAKKSNDVATIIALYKPLGIEFTDPKAVEEIFTFNEDVERAALEKRFPNAFEDEIVEMLDEKEEEITQAFLGFKKDQEWIIDDIISRKESFATIFSRDKSGAVTRARALADIELTTGNNDVEFQYLNSEGNMEYSIIRNHYISALTNFEYIDLVEYFNPVSNPFAANSLAVEAWRGGSKIDIINMGGLRADLLGEMGQKISRLASNDVVTMHLNAILDGISILPRAADQVTEFGIRLPIEMPTRIRQGMGIFLNYLKDEIAATAIGIEAGKNISKYKDNIKKLRFFDSILTDSRGIVQDLLSTPRLLKQIRKEIMFSSKKSTSEIPGESDYLEAFMIENADAFVKDITARLNVDIAKLDSFLVERGLLQETNESGTRVPYALSSELFQEDANEDPDFSDKNINAVLEEIVVKQFIGKTETFKMFLGDPAFYSDMFKRIKGAVGTKTLMDLSPEILKWIDDTPGLHRADGKIDLIAIKEPMARMSEEIIEMYSGQVTPDVLEQWKKPIEKADGALYVDLPTYRLLKITSDQWDNNRESQFSKSMGNISSSYEEVEGATFPPDKFQYMGPFLTDLGPAMGFLKMAIIPISRDMESFNGVEYPNIKKALDYMEENGVGGFVIPTGMKIGGAIETSQVSYGIENGAYEEMEFEDPVKGSRMTFDLRFMGSQLEISPSFKNKATRPTQQAVHISSDLYEDGVAVSEEALEKDSEYQSLMSAATKNAFTDMLEELSIEKTTDKNGVEGYGLSEESYELILDKLENQGIEKDLGKSIMSGVSYLKEKGGAFKFDFFVDRHRMESMFLSGIGSQIIKPKVAGEMLVNTPDLFYEVRKIGDTIASNELQFYENSDGRWAMQVRMPHRFKELLGKNVKIVNGTILGEGITVQSSEELLKMIGIRIPTDGIHSVEVIEIVEFLPQSAGPRINVPAGLVTKAGSDFDIDKLTALFKNYRAYTDEKTGGVILRPDKFYNTEEEWFEANQRRVANKLKDFEAIFKRGFERKLKDEKELNDFLAKFKDDPLLAKEFTDFLERDLDMDMESLSLERNLTKEEAQEMWDGILESAEEFFNITYTVDPTTDVTEQEFYENLPRITQDSNSYYRGTIISPTIDAEGNLIIKGRKDRLYEKANLPSYGVSMGDRMNTSKEYGEGQFKRRLQELRDEYNEQAADELEYGSGYYLIQVDKSKIDNEIIEEAGEVKVLGDLKIPKGAYKIELINPEENKRIQDVEPIESAEGMEEFGYGFLYDLFNLTQPTTEVTEGVSEVFESNPELANVGTEQQYSEYLDSIGVTEIAHHHSESSIEEFKTFPEGYFPNELKKKGTHYKEADDVVFFVKEKLTEEFMSKRPKVGTWGLKASNILQFNGGQKVGDGAHPGIDEGVKKGIDEGYDAVDFGRIRDNKTWSEVIAIFNPRNAVKLGSKQDIQGFKDFVSKKGTTKVAALNISPKLFTDWKAENPTLTKYDLNTKQAIHNKTLDVVEDLLSMKGREKEFLRPVNTNSYEGLAEEIQGLYEDKGNEELPDLQIVKDYHEETTLPHIFKVTDAVFSGAKDVGIVALASTHQVKGQKANLRLDLSKSMKLANGKFLNSLGIYFNYDEFKKEKDSEGEFIGDSTISLARMSDVLNNRRVTDSISQFVNLAVDTVNTPVIHILNLGPELAPAALVLLRAGVPLESIVYFMNQPIVRDYIENRQIASSRVYQALGKEEYPAQTITKLRKAYKTDSDISSPENKPYLSDKELKQMIGGIEAPTKEGDLSIEDQNAYQLHILDDLLMYLELGDRMTTVIAAQSYDTKLPKTRAAMALTNRAYEKVMAEGIFPNAEKITEGENSFLKEMRNYTLVASEVFGDLFVNNNQIKSFNDAYAMKVEELTHTENRQPLDIKVKSLERLEQFFTSLILQRVPNEDGIAINDRSQTLLFGEKSAAVTVSKIINSPKHPLRNNVFLNSLLPVVQEERKSVKGKMVENDFIQPEFKAVNIYDMAAMYDSYQEIVAYDAKKNTTLAKDLFDVAILQAGTMNTPYSFLDKLPGDQFAEISSKLYNRYLKTPNALKFSSELLLSLFHANMLKFPNMVEFTKPQSPKNMRLMYAKRYLDLQQDREFGMGRKQRDIALYQNLIFTRDLITGKINSGESTGVVRIETTGYDSMSYLNTKSDFITYNKKVESSETDPIDPTECP
jgi:hypothetical protein